MQGMVLTGIEAVGLHAMGISGSHSNGLCFFWLSFGAFGFESFIEALH